MPQLQIPVELVILHLAMLAFLEKYQVGYWRPMDYAMPVFRVCKPEGLGRWCVAFARRG